MFQWVKHQLKAHYYLRYCDDFILLSQDKTQLQTWEPQIAKFLHDHLQLQLNERRQLRLVSAGIDFLGYIVRPDYLLVRRRVIGNLWEKLHQTEQQLYQQGLKTDDNGFTLYPYPWPLLTQMSQWINAYLSHFNKASSYQLIQSLRQRFWWLEEYFYWGQKASASKIKTDPNNPKTSVTPNPQIFKVIFRCPIPRIVKRFSQQVYFFLKRLPGHLLLIQLGHFWEIRFSSTCSHRFHHRDLQQMKILLSASGMPVAWIMETGRPIGSIMERALTYRWSN